MWRDPFHADGRSLEETLRTVRRDGIQGAATERPCPRWCAAQARAVGADWFACVVDVYESGLFACDVTCVQIRCRPAAGEAGGVRRKPFSGREDYVAQGGRGTQVLSGVRFGPLTERTLRDPTHLSVRLL